MPILKAMAIYASPVKALTIRVSKSRHVVDNQFIHV